MVTVVDPALFLYLNPSVERTHPNISADEARVLYHTVYSNAGLPIALQLPDHFDEVAYLLENKDRLDISGTNQDINGTLAEPLFTPRFLPFIQKPADYLGRGRFRILDVEPDECTCEPTVPVPYNVSSNLARPGDVVRILQDDVFARDVPILQVTSNVIAVPEHPDWPAGSRYRVLGIGVSDVDRVAHVLFVRHGASSNSTVQEFNPDLYKTLYQDAKHLTDQEAYVQSAAHPDRVINKRMLPSAVDDSVQVCGVSVDSVTPHQALDADEHLLITEYAIKRYVDEKSNWVGPYTFQERVTACNGVDVKFGDVACGDGGIFVGRGGGLFSNAGPGSTVALKAPFVFGDATIHGVSRDSTTPHYAIGGNKFITEYAIKRYVDHKRYWDQPAVFLQAVNAPAGIIVGGDAGYLAPTPVIRHDCSKCCAATTSNVEHPDANSTGGGGGCAGRRTVSACNAVFNAIACGQGGLVVGNAAQINANPYRDLPGVCLPFNLGDNEIAGFSTDASTPHQFLDSNVKRIMSEYAIKRYVDFKSAASTGTVSGQLSVGGGVVSDGGFVVRGTGGGSGAPAQTRISDPWLEINDARVVEVQPGVFPPEMLAALSEYTRLSINSFRVSVSDSNTIFTEVGDRFNAGDKIGVSIGGSNAIITVTGKYSDTVHYIDTALPLGQTYPMSLTTLHSVSVVDLKKVLLELWRTRPPQ